MAGHNAEFVTYGKPKLDGGILTAPVGTKLPTDAIMALDTKFVSLGYVSEDGVENGRDADTDDIRAWGGDKVLSIRNNEENSFTFRLIESVNIEVVKFIYGEDNVTGTQDKFSVEVGSYQMEEKAFVIDQILKNGYLKRTVIPKGKPNLDGNVNYEDDDATGFDIKLDCMVDDNGKYFYEYVQKADGSTSTGTAGSN